MKNPKALGVGAALSAVLLLGFGALQEVGAAFLELPAQWFAVAILPLVLGLVVGGYIKSFKGFGVELEAALKAPVSSVDLTAEDVVADITGDEKRSIDYLENLSPEKTRSMRRLLFVTGEGRNYTAWGITRYLEKLPNLAFFEVHSPSGEVLGFLPVRAVLDLDGRPDDGVLENFVRALQSDGFSSSFPGAAATLRVHGGQSLVDVLNLMRAERAEFTAVMSPAGRYLGVVLASTAG